ncbi:rhodanese-like domain-containing protein [Candidatus Eisenbacteria bacterium]|uniref:Rhodanese-like domain-containing protein n=1 Tax=Eiseniibacteriota bacterium TaxID=2212470 RepID=A0ABV6YIK9_UNCEI
MMRFAILGVLVVASICATAYGHTDLTPPQVNALLDAGENVVIIDVREESEFCDSTYTPPGHISGAINMPWNSGYLQGHYGELSPDDSTIVVCRSGSRSNTAANFLDGVGFAHVFDMLGGMNAWQYETVNCVDSSVPGAGWITTSGLALGPASPNPFKFRTEIPYAIPAGHDPARVTVSIFDARGRLVAEVMETDRGPGSHRVVWDGTDTQGRSVTSGVCFYQLAWHGRTVTRRVVLLR